MTYMMSIAIYNSWLDAGVFDRKGELKHDRGVVDAPGLYALGCHISVAGSRASYTAPRTTCGNLSCISLTTSIGPREVELRSKIPGRHDDRRGVLQMAR